MVSLSYNNLGSDGCVIKENLGHALGQADAAVALRSGSYQALVHPNAVIGELERVVHVRTLIAAACGHRLTRRVGRNKRVTGSIYHTAVGRRLVCGILRQHLERTARGTVPRSAGRTGGEAHLAVADVVGDLLKRGVNNNAAVPRGCGRTGRVPVTLIDEFRGRDCVRRPAEAVGSYHIIDPLAGAKAHCHGNQRCKMNETHHMSCCLVRAIPRTAGALCPVPMLLSS